MLKLISILILSSTTMAIQAYNTGSFSVVMAESTEAVMEQAPRPAQQVLQNFRDTSGLAGALGSMAGNSFPGAGLISNGLEMAQEMMGLDAYSPFRAGFMPNTFDGLAADASNTMGQLGNGFNRFQSTFQGLSNGAQDGYKSMQQSIGNGFSDSEQLLRRMVEMLNNPEQMCQRLAQAASQQVGQQFANSEAILKQLGVGSGSGSNSGNGASNFPQIPSALSNFRPGNMFGR